MTKQEAIDNTLKRMAPYLKQEFLNDAQAAAIGRHLYANLRQVERDERKALVTRAQENN